MISFRHAFRFWKAVLWFKGQKQEIHMCLPMSALEICDYGRPTLSYAAEIGVGAS